MTEVESDEFDADRDRLPSITPEEWAEIKRMTRQESIRPSNIEGESSVFSEFKLKPSKCLRLLVDFKLLFVFKLSSNFLRFDLSFIQFN